MKVEFKLKNINMKPNPAAIKALKERDSSLVGFKEINGYEGYYCINKEGVVVSTRFGKVKTLKANIGNHGYFVVNFCVDRKLKYMTVHRLLALHFISNPNNLPTVNHINGIKTDNRLENLEWLSQKENTIHAHKNGLVKQKKGSKHHKSIKVIDNESGLIYGSIKEASENLSLSRSYLAGMLKGNSKNTTSFSYHN